MNNKFMMNQNLIYYPCFALLLLCFLVLLKLFLSRVHAVKKGKIDFRYFKTFNLNHPVDVPQDIQQAARNFTNLFEVPTLFFMVCLFGLYTQNVDSLFLGLAWFYVALRYIHSLIHLTTNKIFQRMTSYALSCLILLAMGIYLACKI